MKFNINFRKQLKLLKKQGGILTTLLISQLLIALEDLS